MLAKILGLNKGALQEEEVKKRIKGKTAELIDVRRAMEFRMGHLTPCVNIDIKEPDFEKKINLYDRDKTYILYCQSGRRSAKAKRKMKKMGFNSVYCLKGGFKKWDGPLRLK